MILLDTHIWIWWVQGDDRLPSGWKQTLDAVDGESLGVSVMSCWEVAKLAQLRRIELPLRPLEWVSQAIRYPRVRVLDVTPEIAVTANELPGNIHRDPIDQILIATTIKHTAAIMTRDAEIIRYPHVRKYAAQG